MHAATRAPPTAIASSLKPQKREPTESSFSATTLPSTTLLELEFAGAVAVDEIQCDQFADGSPPQPFAHPAMDLRERQAAAVPARGKKRPAAAPALCAVPAPATPARPENCSSASP